MRKKLLCLILLILMISAISVTSIFATYGNKTPEAIEVINETLRIEGINNYLNNYEITLSKIIDADNYEVILSTKDGLIVDSKMEKSNIVNIEIPKSYQINNTELVITAKAYSGTILLKQTLEEKSIKWEYPSISKNNKKQIQDENYALLLEGIIDEDYRLIIRDEKEELYNEIIHENNIVIPNKLYLKKNITLTFELYYDDYLLDSFNLKNIPKTTTTEPNPISELKIKSLKKYHFLKDFEDVNIEFSGGDNADEKTIYIYENNKLIKQEKLTTNSYIVPASTFKMESGYKVTIVAKKKKFKREASVFISTITDGRTRMVETAKSQIGQKGGGPYLEWWGFKGFVPWCAIFVSWVAEQNGFLSTGIIPKYKGCRTGVEWFIKRDQFEKAGGDYKPQKGDIVFFNYTDTPYIDHTGIVEYSDNKYVYVIEGNSGAVPGECKRKKYKLKDKNLYGYGVPNY